MIHNYKYKIKLALLILLGFSIHSFGQIASVRFDGNNALFGSDVNPAGLNLKIGISDNWNYNSRLQFGMEYEFFSVINYQQWTFAKFDYDISITDRISLVPGFGLAQIYHETSYSKDAMCYIGYLELRYWFNDWIGFSLQAERERATDVTQIWRDSAYLGVIIRRI